MNVCEIYREYIGKLCIGLAAMNEQLKKLLIYIVSRLQDEEAEISSIRLIKLLYLIDLEHTIRFGEPLTEIDWVYYKHGPYFMDWPRLVRTTRLDINPEEVKTQAGYRGRTYKIYEEPPKLDEITLSFSSQMVIEDVLKKWMFDDTDVILEHVYDTEPMQQSDYGEPLDLTFAHDVVEAEKALETADDILTFDEILESLGISAAELDSVELDDLE